MSATLRSLCEEYHVSISDGIHALQKLKGPGLPMRVVRNMSAGEVLLLFRMSYGRRGMAVCGK